MVGISETSGGVNWRNIAVTLATGAADSMNEIGSEMG